MLLKDITLATPQENILYDNVLLQLAEEGRQGETLRFWESGQFFVVLGRISKLEQDVHLPNVRRDAIPVLRRSSGGGTVLQGPGCLNYSLVLSKELHPQVVDLKKSYQWILGNIITALDRLGVKAAFRPLSDIALVDGERKISGNAQKRGRKFILHHGTLLYNFDLDEITEYLTMPRDIPEYRNGRRHSDFVANIPAPARSLKDVLTQAFQVSREAKKISNEEENILSRIKQEEGEDNGPRRT
ncbi:MAG: lipoate--protein ligase family protein [Candidatus Omnitrophica bacterium]|nr:lipoate--protein ligase family protein [Candidatus Omnitrophota bacterium]